MDHSSLKIFGWLIVRDMRVLKTDFLNNVIDAMIVPATFIIIAGYILPYLGMPESLRSIYDCKLDGHSWRTLQLTGGDQVT